MSNAGTAIKLWAKMALVGNRLPKKSQEGKTAMPQLHGRETTTGKLARD